MICRLFTAADSDDVSTALQFINRARPWTTLMAVGIGYGANMLTKYLAQVGEETPLTAATCLDNPFDLKHSAAADDDHLTPGFIDMLQSNKELFQGRSKGFDVEKALHAKSLKEFDEAISMVSYGFDSIEEFYVSSSTKDVLANVKIPLLFIQNNAMSTLSIPRCSIAENPFTGLLICTFQSDDKSNTGTFDVSWCQHLVIEWLTAVEVGLLKGRHPLLEDTDVTINPSKHIKMMATKASHASSRSNNLLNLHQLDAFDGNNSISSKKMLKSSDDSSSGKAKDTNGTVKQTNLVDSEAGKEGDVDLVDSERGKVLQSTEVVMKMLDGRMPEALSEEQKEKVLAAVGRGETIMNALQEAVPEDVRGKLTSSVTAILQNQKKALNGISSNSHVPDVISALNTKMQERSGQSKQEKEPSTSELNKGDTSLMEESNNLPSKNDATEPEAHKLEDSSKLKPTNHEELGSDNQTAETSKVKADESSQLHELDSSAIPNISSKAEKSGSSEEHISEQVKLEHDGETKVEKDRQQKEEKDSQSSNPQKNTSTPMSEESSSSSPESQVVAKEDSEKPKKEESSAQPVPSNSNSTSPSFGVSNALDALTGMDDSTQVAVNSVFSVIEDVITQLEGSTDESAIGDKDNLKDTESESDLQHKGDGKSNMPTEPKEMVKHRPNMSISKLSTEKKDEAKVSDKNLDDIRNSVTKLPSRNSLYDSRIQSQLHSNSKNDKLLNSDAATGLTLDYIPEEGQWKLLEKSGDGRINVDDATSRKSIDVNVESPLPSDVECNNDIIEPSYVILDGDDDYDPVGEHKKIGEIKELEIGDDESVVLMQLVKENILHSLKVEVCRRIQATDMENMAPILRKELEHVANTISLVVVRDRQHILSWDGEELVGLNNLLDEDILDAISSAFQGTRYMKEVIPVGIVVGSSLASLRKKFNLNATDPIESTEVVKDQISDSPKGYRLQEDRLADDKVNHNNNFFSEDDGYEDEDVSNSLRNDTVMVGTVTAALGASALLVHQQGSYGDGLESSLTSAMSFNQKENHGKLEEEQSKSSDHNIVSSLAEKAMSVAAPVVPTKEGGEVDQERIVALLADWGQKGGILKLIGKVALLWGGIRGAMSLTGKLISFLRLAERPLFQRILGFISMVLVLWTPVVVPLLPTLVQNWAAHNSSNMAELACIIGFYSSIMILVVLWGKRIRGYEDPLERYGLELRSARQIKNFLWGLVGGVMLVLLIQSTNVLFGFVSLSWPAIPSSADAVTVLKLFGQVLRFVGQGLVTTVAVALVEEVLFRSWLPEEIALDLGYNRGIILSGLAFSISQWSLKAIPGLWLLSLGLAGIRQKCQGSLSLPIGLRAGIMASSFILKEGGFLIYQPTYPFWLSGGDAFQPFNGIAGLAVALFLAAILYPRKPQNEDTLKDDIK